MGKEIKEDCEEDFYLLDKKSEALERTIVLEY
jgi:hypothetical protein